MTILKLATAKTPYLVRESYDTIKRRILTGELFFEVSMPDRKVMISKLIVEEFATDKPVVKVAKRRKGGKR